MSRKKRLDDLWEAVTFAEAVAEKPKKDDSAKMGHGGDYDMY